MKQFLIVGPAWLGDMVMSQTLLKLLKREQPDCQIDVLAPKATLAMAEMMPEVRDTLVMPLGHGQLQLGVRRKLGKTLREKFYDQAFVLPNSLKSAIVPFVAKIPVRTGWLGECRWVLLNDARKLDKKAYPLMIERFIALGLPKGAKLPPLEPLYPQLKVPAQLQQQALEKVGLTKPTQPVIALCPGAEYGPAKQWPIQHFAAVAKAKLNEGWQVWVLGGPKDVEVSQAICDGAGIGCLNLAGKTTVPEAVGLLSLTSQVVSNDSGLMHIAAALQRALVVVYGSSSPGFTPPLSQTVKSLSLHLECSPCFERRCPLQHLDCLRKLEPKQVLSALEELTCVS